MAYYVPVDQGQDESPLGAFQPSFGASFKAAVQSTFNENASTLAYDAYKAYDAQTSPYAGRRIPKADAESQAKALGVKVDVPEDGYTQEALDILIKRRQDQAARQAIDDRTPWGFGSVIRGSAQLMTGLVDPLNVASAFIPFVGEARAARFIEQAGEGMFARASARAAIGAVEGAGGAAVLEPLVYGAHSYLGDDYHMTDSLINLAFGGAMGGVLHAGAGVLPDVRARALRRELDTLLKDSPAGTVPEGVRAELRRMVDEGDLASVTAAPFARAGDVDMATAVREAAQQMEPQWRAQLEAEAKGLAPADAVAKDGAPAALEPEAAARAAEDLAALNRGEIPERFAQQVQERAQARMLATELARSMMDKPGVPAEHVIGMASPETREAAMHSALADSIAGRVPDVDALIRGRSLDEVRAAVQRQQGADALAVGSPEASRAATARLEAAPKETGGEPTSPAVEHLADAMEQVKQVQATLEAGGMDPKRLERGAEALKAFDEAIADAKRIGQALEQYAQCGVMQ